MVDEFSKVHSTCNIDTDANILESELKKDVVVKNFTRVLKSKLGEKVQLDRNNSILYCSICGNIVYPFFIRYNSIFKKYSRFGKFWN